MTPRNTVEPESKRSQLSSGQGRQPQPTTGGQYDRLERNCIQTWVNSFRGAGCVRFKRRVEDALNPPKMPPNVGDMPQPTVGGGRRDPDLGSASTTNGGSFEHLMLTSTDLVLARSVPIQSAVRSQRKRQLF